MATNDIPLKVSDNTERVSLRVSDGRSARSITPDSGSPYYVGARAYVTQTDSGAVVTVIDKDGTTTATILNGADGEDGNGIASIVMNDDYTLTIVMDDGTSLTTDPIKGEDGADGYTPIKGVDYFDGQDGADGADGYTPIKGVDYFDGVDGKDGKDGKDGTDGQDGYTPIKGVDYFDGEDGADGKDGTDGQDGFSPSASVTKVGDTATITITDKNGTTTATVSDGTDGTDGRDVFYGTCDTAAATAAKVVDCSDFTAEDLKAGAMLLVHFDETNSGAVASLSLNVNNTGAKNVKYINNGTLGNLTSAGYLKANTTYLFVYDGTYWVVYLNYNTTYSSMTDAEYQAGTSTSARTITPARLKAAIQYHETPVSITRYTTSGTNIADLTIGDTTTKLYAPTGGGGGGITDVTVDGTSVVQGTVAAVDLTGKSDIGHTHTKSAITDFPTLATVATSGDYDDLTNKPTIPTKTMWVGECSSNSTARVVTTTTGDFVLAAGNSVRIAFAYASQGGVYLDIDGTGSKSLYNAPYKWQANEIVDVIYDGSTYVLVDGATASTVYYGVTKLSDEINSTRQDIAATSYAVKRAYDLANSKSDFSGDYDDLTNKPTIPTVPTNVSAFTNDAGYLTSYTETDPTVPAWAKAASKPTYTASEVGALPSTTSIPSKTSDLTNDSGFITGYTETDPIFSASAAHGITSSDITTWNGKSDFSGDYDDLTNKPTIQTIYASTVAPTSADGEDGDVWFVY